MTDTLGMEEAWVLEYPLPMAHSLIERHLHAATGVLRETHWTLGQDGQRRGEPVCFYYFQHEASRKQHSTAEAALAEATEKKWRRA
jgi:hypothetical protein